MAEFSIAITADNEEAKKAFAQLIESVKKTNNLLNESNKVSKNAFSSFIGNLASSATMKAFSLFQDGVKKIQDFIEDSIKASADAGKNLQQFNIALALSGKYSKATSLEFQNLASALQETTTFEDDAIIKSAALIQTMAKLDKEGLKRATQSSLDLAAALGIDLATASNLVAKAALGNTQALGRYGIYIKQSGDATKDFAEFLRVVNAQFGGAAQGQTQSYAGAISQLANTFGDLQETVGDLVTKNPLIVQGIQDMKQVFKDLQKSIQDNEAALKILISDGLMGMVRAIPVVVDSVLSGLKKIHDGFTGLADAGTKAINAIVGPKFLLMARILTGGGGESAPAAPTPYGDDAMYTNKGRMSGEKAQIAEADEYLKKLSAQNQGVTAGTKGDQDFEEKFLQYRRRTKDELFKLQQAADKKMEGALAAGANDPFGTIDRSGFQTNQQLRQFDTLTMAGRVAGGLGLVNQGAAGARSAVTGAARAVGNAYIPGLGEAIGPVIEALTGGPEATRAFVKSFTDAIPDLIQGLIEAVPAFIEELANQAPVVIDRLAQKAPIIIDSLVKAAPGVITALVMEVPRIADTLAMNMPSVAVSFAKAMVAQAPMIAVETVKEMVSQIGKSFGNVFGGGSSGGGILGNVVSAVTSPFKKLKFAEGGQGFVRNVPTGFPNDSFPAALTSGELVVDRSTASQLKQFLQGRQMEGEMSNSILLKILEAVSSPLSVSSEITLNRKAFADLLLDLSRTNARTA